MADKFVLLVSDQEDGKQGEITLLDTAQEMARFIETLLEAGCDEARLRVFSGAETGFEVTHRPVVSLADGDAEGSTNSDGGGENEPQGAETEEAREAVAVGAQGGHGDGSRPVRFSHLFRRGDSGASRVYASACEAAA